MAQSGGDKEFSEQLIPLMEQLRIMLEAGIKQKLFPSCTVGCGDKMGNTFIATAGTVDGIIPVTTRYQYDIASVSKAILAYAVLKSFSFEQLEKTRAIEFIQMKGKHRDLITLKHLLTFGVEFGSNVKLSSCDDKDALVDMLLNGDLPRIPGPLYRYTNVSSMLLGFCLEKFHGATLDVILNDLVFKPLKMSSTGYVAGDLIVPSEPTIRGRVQDERSFLYGSPSGAAGIFSTGYDLLRFGKAFFDFDVQFLEKLITPQFGSAASNFGYGFGLRHHNEFGLLNGGNMPIPVLKKNGFSGAHWCALPFHNLTFVCLANICYPNRPSAETRDLFTSFHKEILHFFYENQEMFLGDFNQTRNVNFTH